MTRDDLAGELRRVRGRYDALNRGETAPLRRCRNAGELSLEGAFWRAGGSLVHTPQGTHLPHVVLHFPLAKQVRSLGAHAFSMGRFLKNKLGRPGDEGNDSLRFRRLLDSRDREDLDHRLRGILRLACADGSTVDWGALGCDLLWFFADSDNVRRTWAQDFYSPVPNLTSGS